MIRHIVFFSIKLGQDMEQVRHALERLKAIPYSDVFEVLPNLKVDPLSNEIDLVVYAEFANEAALSAYKAHPIYEKTTQQVRPLRELRYSAQCYSQSKKLTDPISSNDKRHPISTHIAQ